MSAFRIQAVMALAEDFCLSLIMKATISTMATAMKPAPMFRDFHGLVTPVTATFGLVAASRVLKKIAERGARAEKESVGSISEA